jgi:hypothetical protein
MTAHHIKRKRRETDKETKSKKRQMNTSMNHEFSPYKTFSIYELSVNVIGSKNSHYTFISFFFFWFNCTALHLNSEGSHFESRLECGLC